MVKKFAPKMKMKKRNRALFQSSAFLPESFENCFVKAGLLTYSSC